jgi:hypothetical protein
MLEHHHKSNRTAITRAAAAAAKKKKRYPNHKNVPSVCVRANISVRRLAAISSVGNVLLAGARARPHQSVPFAASGLSRQKYELYIITTDTFLYSIIS